jgi:negative regulator of flagellin synthesis FlgM
MMKIGPIEPKVPSATTPVAERRNNGQAPAVGKADEASAKVVLSANAAAAGAEDATFDKAKVEKIAAAIREGRFQIDSGAVADKLIQNAQEVLGRLRN